MLRAHHFPKVSDLWRWTPPGRTHAVQAFAAAVGMGGPLLVGVAAGQVQAGLAAAMGGLILSTTEPVGSTLREKVTSVALPVVICGGGLAIGFLLAPHGLWLTFGLPLLAATVALLGGMSMPLAVASVQFIVLLTIAAGMGEHGGPLGGLLLLFLAGTVWTGGVLLALDWGLYSTGRAGSRAKPPPAAPKRKPTLRQLFRRWRGNLKTLAGWQYALRAGSCLSAAEALNWLWAGHHGYWIGVTVAVTLGRPLPAPPTRTLERLIGTVLGVLLAGGLLGWGPSLWAIVALIAVMAAARPALRSANYVAYAAVMTPLVMLIIDLGAEPSWDLLADRLVATFAGCAIVLVLGYLAWFRYTGPESTGAGNSGSPADPHPESGNTK